MFFILLAVNLLVGSALAWHSPCGHVDYQGMDPRAFWESCNQVSLDSCDCPEGEGCCPSVAVVDGEKKCQMSCKVGDVSSGHGSQNGDLKCPHPKIPEGVNYWTFKKACGWTPQCDNCDAGEFCCRTVGDDDQCKWGCVTPVQKTNRWQTCPHLSNIDHATFWKSCISSSDSSGSDGEDNDNDNGGRGGRGGRRGRGFGKKMKKMAAKWGWGNKCSSECAADEKCCAKKTDEGTCAFECAAKLDPTPKAGSCANPADGNWLKLNKIYCYMARKQGLVAESDCRHDGDCEGNRKCCMPAVAEDDPAHSKCRRVCQTPVGDDEDEESPVEE